MNTTARRFAVVGGIVCLVPITLLYLFGLLFFVVLCFSANTFSIALTWAAAIVLPGFSLHAVWQLLFRIDALLDADRKKPPAYLWVGVGMGVLLSVFLCSTVTNDIQLLLTFGAPSVVAGGLALAYVHAEREAKQAHIPIEAMGADAAKAEVLQNKEAV